MIIRWKFRPNKDFTPRRGCCLSAEVIKKNEHYLNLIYVKKIEKHEKLFYEKIAIKKRAV